MHPPNGLSDSELVSETDRIHIWIGTQQRAHVGTWDEPERHPPQGRCGRETRSGGRQGRPATRSLRWWFDDTASDFSLWAELPQTRVRVLAAALTRTADRIPATPKGQDQPWWPVEARRANAVGSPEEDLGGLV